MSTDLYPSDLSDKEWAILPPLIFPGKQAGHPQVFELCRIVDARFYLLRTRRNTKCLRQGCQWRALPHDIPPWTAVFYHYAEWHCRGTWEEINTSLRELAETLRACGWHRVAHGREVQPTAAIVTRRPVPGIDSQSARTTEAGGRRGYDGGKRVSGHKRHILVDTEGTLLKACVHPADIHERRGAELLLEGLKTKFPSIALVWADSADQGLKTRLTQVLGWTLTISKHGWTGSRGVWVAPGQQPPEIPRGLHVLKRPWVVEQMLAWFGRNRRMSRDYERLIATAEMLLYACMARVTLNWFTQQT